MRKPDYPEADPRRWSLVDTYFSDLLCADDAVLIECLERNSRSGLPAHDVSATQGQMLAIYAKMVGAKRVLEIGTLGGYSTIRLARALPDDGVVVTIEANANYADVARMNLKRAGVEGQVDLRVGKALDVLPGLIGPFDLIFIDADKPNNPNYLTHALRLARPGTVIVGDNVVRGGQVIDAVSGDANVQGVRSFLELIAEEPRLTSTSVQTVGEKGWDGFALAFVER
jgi:predicted O-methyltransferase YrrM